MSLSWLPDFVAVDIETTGLAAQQDDLLEIAGVKFVGGVPVDRFVTTLQLDHAITRRTARLTGLTDSALADGLPVAEALHGLNQFVGDLPVVAHNVSLDREFLTRYSRGLDGVDFTDNQWWDSLELAALVFPELESLALEQVAIALNIQVETTHRAEADATLAGLIFAGLFAHIQTHWPAELTDTIRTLDLAQEPVGELLRRMPLPSYAPTTPQPLPIAEAGQELQLVPEDGDEARALSLIRVDDPTDALQEGALTGHRLLYPPHIYPGQFHGPDKELRAHATQLGITCASGPHCLLDLEKLELLQAGGIAVPGKLRPFELAFLRAWATLSTNHDFARLSWWALNNFPTLATTLLRLSTERSDLTQTAEFTPDAGAMRLQPWETALRMRFPWGPSAGHPDDTAPFAVLVPVYYPLHALRCAIRIWQVTALAEELRWYGKRVMEIGGLPALWWADAGPAMLTALQSLDRTLASYGADLQSPNCISRGEEYYWPLPHGEESTEPEREVLRAINAVAEAFAAHLPAGREALGKATIPPALQRVLAIGLRRFESARIAAQWMGASDSGACLVVVKQQYGREVTWWGIASAPTLPRNIAELIPGEAPLPMISTFLDAADWREVERIWRADHREVSYTDHMTPIPKGNTVHLPLPPPGATGTPAKKTWQNWQLSILRRLMQRGKGRWLIVARNPQDVVTLHHRLRDTMLAADWQPLFQRHDGTKGFLMREFGSFDKVVMVATGEILQELNRFPVAPDTIVIMHVPTRPPNELVAVALQQQFGMTSEAFREEVLVPLGILDLKRAFYRWPAYREGTANLYLIDFRQLELPQLKTMLRATFTNEELIDTRPAVQY